MQNKKPDNTYLLYVEQSLDEKISLANNELERLIKHFNNRANIGKRNFQLYKYASIIIAAITTIVSSSQVIYTSSFPHWILPIVSAGTTVAVAFLGASSAQKIWINSRTTQQQLQAEKFLFNQQSEKYASISEEERIKLFSEKMIRLWNDGHGKWEQTVGDD